MLSWTRKRKEKKPIIYILHYTSVVKRAEGTNTNDLQRFPLLRYGHG